MNKEQNKYRKFYRNTNIISSIPENDINRKNEIINFDLLLNSYFINIYKIIKYILFELQKMNNSTMNDNTTNNSTINDSNQIIKINKYVEENIIMKNICEFYYDLDLQNKNYIIIKDDISLIYSKINNN